MINFIKKLLTIISFHIIIVPIMVFMAVTSPLWSLVVGYFFSEKYNKK